MYNESTTLFVVEKNPLRLYFISLFQIIQKIALRIDKGRWIDTGGIVSNSK